MDKERERKGERGKRERGTEWLTNRGDLWPSAQFLRTYAPQQLNQPTNISLSGMSLNKDEGDRGRKGAGQAGNAK